MIEVVSSDQDIALLKQVHRDNLTKFAMQSFRFRPKSIFFLNPLLVQSVTAREGQKVAKSF